MSVHEAASDFISPITINGLNGRMLYLPAPKNKKREIMYVYGHHSSLERWWGAAQLLNKYGAVTVPDLPGFGGMDSLYKAGRKPTIDNLADYLATFIKLRYRRKKITIAGLSLGFVVVTRMLQRYPELTDKVELLVSVAGFAHHEDFTFSKPRLWMYRTLAWFNSRRLPALLFRYTFLTAPVLWLAYARTHNAQQRFANLSPEDARKTMDFEIHLWQTNDVRTQAITSLEFFRLDNCKVRVNLPVYHVSMKTDRYFDNHVVEQHMRVIFNDFVDMPSKIDNHAPSIIADMKTAAPMLPPKLRRILAQS